MKKSAATVVREYGPYPEANKVGGVTYDGKNVWAAVGDKLNTIDPDSGKLSRSLKVSADAGTAFDGTHLYQIAESRIQKVDPASGKVLSTIPAPGNGGDSGLAWAEGSLWVGEYRGRKIHQVDPATGAAATPADPATPTTAATPAAKEDELAPDATGTTDEAKAREDTKKAKKKGDKPR